MQLERRPVKGRSRPSGAIAAHRQHRVSKRIIAAASRPQRLVKR